MSSRDRATIHARLREAPDLSFHEIETLVKERGAGQDVSLEEFEAGRDLLGKARPQIKYTTI